MNSHAWFVRVREEQTSRRWMSFLRSMTSNHRLRCGNEAPSATYSIEGSSAAEPCGRRGMEKAIRSLKSGVYRLASATLARFDHVFALT